MTGRGPCDENPTSGPARPRDRTHWLYVGVIVGVLAGVVVGLLAPQLGAQMGVLGTMFVNLIKMMIAPVIFCTIKLTAVGKVGGLAFAYFMVMSTLALGVGLVVGNLLHPGEDLKLAPSMAGKGAQLAEKAQQSGGAVDFIKNIIPTTLFSSLTDGNVLQALFVALLVGFAIQALGGKGEPILSGVEHLQRLVFKILSMVLWLAPIGAFGAIANVVGQTGWGAVRSLAFLMLGFYLTCAIFIFGLLGLLLRVVSGVSIFALVRYLAREYLLIFATSSSESALPRLIAKMEHLGVQPSTVGIVVPTGYSFNLDGTAIYLTMASLFIADVMGAPMSVSQQVGLLAFMIVASKGAAGVSGAGLATLAGGLQAHRPDLLDGVGLIVGIDRFMAEARSVTNFSGNAVATLIIGSWTRTVDATKVKAVLGGQDPFDEITMIDEHGSTGQAVAVTRQTYRRADGDRTG